jgi:pyruvate kinase
MTLLDRVDQLIAELVAATDKQRDALARVHPANQASAINLVHYLTLRRNDLRRLQMELTELGISSLGHSEGRTLYNLVQVRARIRDMLVASGASVPDAAVPTELVTPTRCEELLHRNTRALFGPRPSSRHVYVMVTLPDASEVTPRWARDVLQAGASCFRVNTAHEDAVAWLRAVLVIREQAKALGREVRILVDLEGPKLRTLPLGPGVAVLKLRPPKNDLGVIAGALAIGLALEGGPTTIALTREQLELIRVGDELRFRDARDKKRRLVVTHIADAHVETLLDATTYITDETQLVLWRRDKELARFRPGLLPRLPTSVKLGIDDQLWLVGDAARTDSRRHEFLEVGITLPAVLSSLEVGHRVLIDDGRLATVVVETRPDRALLRVTRAPAAGFRIRGEMGVNLPDTPTTAVPAISDKDRDSLVFAIKYADMVGLSFVRTPDDVRAIRERLEAAQRPIGLVLKIETSSGFRQLGELLLEALRYHPVGVMIARGDLAIEVGFERLAELQEEILWLSEAAHVPVIWATQVLESLAKTGMPSRGEVTDAAMSVRAECVMLNKGEFIAPAVQMLDSILHRMESHQYKKMALYRPLLFR